MAALAPEILFHIGSFPITNTVTNTVLVDAVLILLAWYINKHASIIPSKFQSAMELIIEGFYNLIESVSKTHTMRIFPYVMTFFLFILISNWSGLLPIITAIEWVGHGGHHEGEHMIPLFRSASTDLNTTLALAFVSLVATHTMSITTFGIKSYLSRFFSLNPMAMYTGL